MSLRAEDLPVHSGAGTDSLVVQVEAMEALGSELPYTSRSTPYR